MPYFIGIAIILTIIFSIVSIRDLRLLLTVTRLNRGTKSERNLVVKLLKAGTPAKSVFHDLYVKKISNGYSQIDLVAVTEAGIIVIEVKDYSGWIFGEWNQKTWTQMLAYGRQKYKFYNPIMQNSTHIEVLRKKIAIQQDIPFYSFVIFYGSSEFKNINYVPEGTYLFKPRHLKAMLKNVMDNNNKITYSNYDLVVEELKKAVENGNNHNIRDQHVKNIRNLQL